MYFGSSSSSSSTRLPLTQRGSTPILPYADSTASVVATPGITVPGTGRTRRGGMAKRAAAKREPLKLDQLPKDPNGPCADGCPKEAVTWQGSNVFWRIATCLKCGYQQRTKVVKHAVVAFEECKHTSISAKYSDA